MIGWALFGWFVLGSFSWLWVVLGGGGQFWLILCGCGLLVVLANFRYLWEVMGYFDNSVQCWKVLGGFGCL